MAQNLIQNGIIKFISHTEGIRMDYSEWSDTYLVIDVARLPKYRDEITRNLDIVYDVQRQGVFNHREKHEVNSGGLMGVHYQHSSVVEEKTIEAVQELVARFSKEFQLWNIPFIPKKGEEDTLEVLLNTVHWYRSGKIYVPDRIIFDGAPGELIRVLEFYGGFPSITPQ